MWKLPANVDLQNSRESRWMAQLLIPAMIQPFPVLPFLRCKQVISVRWQTEVIQSPLSTQTVRQTLTWQLEQQVVNIFMTMVLNGNPMQIITGMSATVEIRRMKQHTASSGLLTRKLPQPKRVPSMKNARPAVTNARQLKFLQQEQRLLRQTQQSLMTQQSPEIPMAAKNLRRPEITAIYSFGLHCCLFR